MIAGSAATRAALNRGLAATAIVLNASSKNWKRRESRFSNHSGLRCSNCLRRRRSGDRPRAFGNRIELIG